MPTFTFRCGWCQSKDQTTDIVHHHTFSQQNHMRDEETRYRMSLLCRRCKRYSTITAEGTYPVPDHLKKYGYTHGGVGEEIFKDPGDITEAFSDRYSQTPSAAPEITTEVPLTVRESWLDAAEARSARAQCQSYRTALEFALREAGIAGTPGKTLGGLLLEARGRFAISDALIELCDQVKAFGNWGLHWAETDISNEDAVAAKTITKAILDYLFVLPSEVVKARARTDQAKVNHQTGASKGSKTP